MNFKTIASGPWLVLLATFLVCSVCLSDVHADARTYKQYIYDNAGNIVGIRSDVSQSPPSVTDLSPVAARIGDTTTLVATGEGLFGVVITPADSTVVIRVTDSDSSQAQFDFTAANATPIGPYALTFTTGLGSSVRTIEVQPALPGISVAPSPAVLAPGSGPATMDIRLTSADLMDHTLNLSITNPTVASLSAGSITILAGSTEPETPATLTPLALGNATMQITSGSLTDLAVPVFVTGEYVPPMGDSTFYNQILGVELNPGPQPPEFELKGPFSSTLSILKQSDTPAAPHIISPLLAKQLGVVWSDQLLQRITPNTVLNNTGPVPLIVTGIGLDAVTSVQVVPPEGLLLDATSINTEGTELTIPVTVAPDAPTGIRQLVLTAGAQLVQPAEASADRFNVADLLPEITSIEPVVVVRDTPSVAFTVRGRNLRELRSITLAPDTGMVGANPVVNETGTELYFNLSVPATEPLGERTLTVTTLAGTSASAASAANTFTVVNEPGQSFQNLLAATVGVELLSTEPSVEPARGQIRASILGVTYGGVITGINPAFRRIGETFTLTVQGSGLEGTDVVDFLPNEGISVLTPVVALDGQTVTVDVSIAADAPQTVRRVVVVDDGEFIPASAPDITSFLVTGFEPQIDSVSPIAIEIGAPPVQLVARGQFLNDTVSVRALPETEGITISPPVVNESGTEVRVDISVASGVLPGQRVIVVQTPSGVTSTLSRHSNTINIVGTIVTEISNLISPQLGVIIETEPAQPVPEEIYAQSLGVALEEVVVPIIEQFDVHVTQLGVSLGSVAHSILPTALAVDSAATLVIEGFMLNDVIGISFVPAQGISLSGPLAISGDGTAVTVPIAVASDAVTGVREVVVSTSTGMLAFTDATQNRLRIATSSPEISSIAPIQAAQGDTVPLLIRGLGLNDATAVIASPADEITFAAAPVVNAQGTELTVEMQIGATAVTGSRVITVVTPVGNSGLDATAANSFNIVPLE